jgi:predicted dehydrogenase
MDIFDLYQIGLEFESGAAGSVIVDMIQRSPSRICKLMSEEGQIEWDYTEGLVRLYVARDRNWIEYREPPGESGYQKEGGPEDEPLYVAETRAFLEAVEGKSEFPFHFSDERKILEIVHAAEESSATGRFVKLSPAYAKK